MSASAGRAARHAGAVTSPPEQQALIEHSSGCHGVVLAGPGTGKRTPVLRLVARLAEEEPGAKVITFTRAATAELVATIPEKGHGLVEPSMVHAFALSLAIGAGDRPVAGQSRVPDRAAATSCLTATRQRLRHYYTIAHHPSAGCSGGFGPLPRR